MQAATFPVMGPIVIQDNPVSEEPQHQIAFPQPDTQPQWIERKQKYYPGFGEAAGTIQEMSFVQKALLVTSLALPIITAAAIGFATGNIFGAIAGGALASITVFGALGGIALIRHVWQYRFQRTLSQEGAHPSVSIQDNAHQVRLGKYAKADLRISPVANESFEWKLKLIRSAKQSIELSPNFAGGPYFQRALDAIDATMTENENVSTHILLSFDQIETRDSDRLKALQEKYPNRFKFLVSPRVTHILPTLHTEENHVKLLVVDGRYFTVGGTGMQEQLSREASSPEQGISGTSIGSKFVPEGVRDLDTIGKSDELGPLLREQFFKLFQVWEMRANNAPAQSRFFPISQAQKGICEDFEEEDGKIVRDAKTKVLVCGAEHNEDGNSITQEYVKRISKAKDKIHLANFVLDPVPAIRNALQAARETSPNVKIKGYTCGKKHLPFQLIPITTLRSRGAYSLFNKVYEYDQERQWLHKKSALFDDSHVICSSYNHGVKSGKYDHEIALVIKNKQVARLFKNILNEDKQRSTPHNSEDIQRAAFINSLGGRICSYLFGRFC